MITVKMNPDKEHVAEVRKALRKNGGYCPCAVAKSKDTRCICRDFREQIDKGISGKCHCGLYVCEVTDESIT